MITLDDLSATAEKAIENAPDAPALDKLSRALIDLGCRVSVCSLDRSAISESVDQAFAAGASVKQVQETIALISGLGVHSLMASSVTVLEAARQTGAQGAPGDELDENRTILWDRYVGGDPFWAGFEAEFPGFLRSMLLLSPDIFEAFFAYCAVPWKSGTVRALTKELIAMASDSTPAHRFAPGFRVHLRNALSLGASKAMVREALSIAAKSPPHIGTD